MLARRSVMPIPEFYVGESLTLFVYLFIFSIALGDYGVEPDCFPEPLHGAGLLHLQWLPYLACAAPLVFPSLEDTEA